MAALSFALALYLRVGDEMLTKEPRLTLLYGVSFTVIAAVIFLVTGLYRGIWRYAWLPVLFNTARAATLTELVFLPVMFLFTRLDTLPRSFLLIDWLVLIALLGAPRLGYRAFKDRGLDHLVERRGARIPVQRDQHQPVDQQKRPRQGIEPGEEKHHRQKHQLGQCRGPRDVEQIGQRGITPDAAIEPGHQENNRGDHGERDPVKEGQPRLFR